MDCPATFSAFYKKEYRLIDIINDIECYVPTPRKEILHILKLVFPLMALRALEGKAAIIPNFGRFTMDTIEAQDFFDVRAQAKIPYPKRFILRFKPSRFMHWLFTPALRSKYKKIYRLKWYYIYLYKLKDEMWNHHDLINKFIPDMPEDQPELPEDINKQLNSSLRRSFLNFKQ